MKRHGNVLSSILAVLGMIMVTVWTVPAMAGDPWLDAHGIRTDNVTLNGLHVTNATYWQDPPFLSTKVPPNVMIVLDNSGSMNGQAYVTTYMPTQFASGHYYGYFDPTKMYRYASQRWSPTTDDPATATAASPIASGNFLNWATMTRLEAAKKLLVGGKANPRSMTSGCCVKLTGEANADNFLKPFWNNYAMPATHIIPPYNNVIYPFKGYYGYRRDGDTFTIATLSTNTPVMPTSDILTFDWTYTGGSDHFDAINDPTTTSPPYDLDNSYIQNTVSTNPALFNIAPQAAYGSGAITSVSIFIVAKRVAATTADRNRTYDFRALARVGGNTYPSQSSTLIKTTGYTEYLIDFNMNPKTGLPWEWEDILGGAPTQSLNALEGIGVASITTPNNNLYMRVTQMFVRVNYNAPSGSYNVVVDTGTSDIHGIIDDLGDDARFGLAYYNNGCGLETPCNTSNGRNDGGRVQTYIDFATPTAMITSVGNLNANTWTPLAETLHEMIRYFRQDAPYYTGNSPADYQVGQNYDPYYFQYSRVAGSGLADQYVPCAKSFILFLTDGESTKDQNIPANLRDFDGDGRDPGSYASHGTDYMDDVALWGRTVDHRTDLTGNQNVILYPVFMFGQGSDLLKRAAIDGGFDDLNGDNRPGPDLKEYTRDSDGDGDIDANDLPMTYFEGDDGYALQASIIDAISAIMKRAASGTSVSVLGSSWRGEGSIFQAYFYPERVEDLRRIKWTGYFRSLFVDRRGLLHEDTNGDGKLTPSSDRVVKFVFIAGQDTKAEFYWDRINNTTNSNIPDGKPDTASPLETLAMSDTKPVWDASKLLAYRDPASRTIYTSINAPDLTPSLVPFDTANASTLRPFIRGKTDTDAENLIRFIRGEQLPGWRDRQLTVDGALRTWKLSDIVFSDPVVVPAPKEKYDIFYGSQSYHKYYTQWKYRRAVVLVGSNDGMLHAFNSGFSIPGSDDPDSNANTTQVTFCERLLFDNNGTPTGCVGDPQKPLGKELWTFIPYDVLPHLAWQADPDYQHVYYVDMATRVTDARIFTPDNTTHIDGWGTVAIVGLRMGGGEIDVQDNFGSVAGIEKRAFKSAYYLLDITNPELPPTLLWRFSDDELGFSNTFASIVREGGGPEDVGNWIALFGSGPSNYRGGRVVANDIVNTKFTKSGQVAGLSGMSSTNPQLFAVDLRTGRPLPSWTEHPTMSGTGRKGVIKLSSAENNGFAASPAITDYPSDFKYDVVYAGTTYCASGCAADGSGTWAGNMYRIRTGNDPDPGRWELSKFYTPVVVDDDNQLRPKPITTTPSFALDGFNHVWVYFGTGRFLHIDDRFDSSKQAFFGIKDQCYASDPAAFNLNGCPDVAETGLTNLLDSNDYEVLTSGMLFPPVAPNTLPNQPAELGSFTQLNEFMSLTGKGWHIKLDTRERITVNGFVMGGIAGFGSYTPTDDVCEFEGFSKQYYPAYLTGTAPYFPPGTEAPTYNTAGGLAFAKSVFSGGGLPSAPAVHTDSKGKSKLFIQQSTGAITVLDLPKYINVRGGFGPVVELDSCQ